MKTLKVLLLISIFFFTSGCILKKEDQVINVGTNQLANQNSNEIKEKTLKNLEAAKKTALAWKEDAQFVGYNIDVPKDMNPKSIVETYVFGSEEEADYWWTYSINSEGQGVRAMVYKDDYLGKELKQIEENFWKTSFTEAIKTADDGGGLKFRAENPETEMTLLLSQSNPKGWLWYVVEYQGSNDKLQIRISANDGKIYDNQGNLKNN